MKSRGPTPHRQLVRLQKRIFRSLQAEADWLLGSVPEAIRKYEREQRRDFQTALRMDASRLRPTSKRELVTAVRGADVTLVGDFHTFSQAQRTALRLMRAAIHPGETWFLGLEFVPSDRQAELDRYQQGRLSADEFHAAIHYHDDWGFPWDHYEPLLRWARENGVRAIALNRPKLLPRAGFRRPSSRGRKLSKREQALFEDARELDERDRWAAGIIADLFGDRPRAERARMLVLYGDLHVGRMHLPRRISEVSRPYLGSPLRTVSIHQNEDALYWKLAEAGREHRTEAVRLGPDAFCVISGTPWAKLQSLVSWGEGGRSEAPAIPTPTLKRGPGTGRSERFQSDFDDDEGADGTSIDWLSLVRTYGGAVAELLEIEPATHDRLNIATIQDNDAVKIAEASGRAWSMVERAVLRHQIEQNLRLYVPHPPVAYLGSPSQNNAAELAAIHLLRHHTRFRQLIRDTDGNSEFARIALEFAFGFFGSLLINPRRKCDLRADHERRLRELKRGARATFRGEAEARTLALRALPRPGAKTPRRLPPELFARAASASVAFGSARFVGYILGSQLHPALLHGRITLGEIRTIFLPRDLASVAERYARLVRLIDPSRTPRVARNKL